MKNQRNDRIENQSYRSASFEQILEKSDEFLWNPKCGVDPRKLPEDLQYSWKWKGEPISYGTRIAVEKIRCPVFLSQGMKDSIWPAKQSKEIEATLKEHQRPHEAIFYEDEDHWLNIEAAYDRQKRVLSFFRKNLADQ